ARQDRAAGLDVLDDRFGIARFMHRAGRLEAYLVADDYLRLARAGQRLAGRAEEARPLRVVDTLDLAEERVDLDHAPDRQGSDALVDLVGPELGRTEDLGLLGVLAGRGEALGLLDLLKPAFQVLAGDVLLTMCLPTTFAHAGECDG